MIKKSIDQKNVTVLNIYAPDNWILRWWSKNWLIELQGERHKSTIILKYFNAPLSIINKISRQKSVKNTKDLNNTVN